MVAKAPGKVSLRSADSPPVEMRIIQKKILEFPKKRNSCNNFSKMLFLLALEISGNSERKF